MRQIKENPNYYITDVEIVSHLENMRHAKSSGFMIKGSNVHSSKLKEFEVVKIKKLLREGVLNQRQIAKLMHVHFVTVNDIKTRRTWGHVK